MIRSLSLLVCLSLSASVLAENWPCWRGPRGDGTSAESQIPVEWNGETGEGIMAIVRPAAKMEVLHRNPLGEFSYASPAISNGQIFIRGEHHLFAIGTDSTNPASAPR